MNSLVSFIINSALLGVGLAMDAFSVSMANGLSVPKMSRAMRIAIPLTFAVFQFFNAHDWLVLRKECRRGVYFFPAGYPVDCAGAASIHWREDADRRISRR